MWKFMFFNVYFDETDLGSRILTRGQYSHSSGGLFGVGEQRSSTKGEAASKTKSPKTGTSH